MSDTGSPIIVPMVVESAIQAGPEPESLARLAVDVASDKQASDIQMLDIRQVSSFADFFVVLTVDSTRQMGALTEHLEEALEGAGAERLRREGTAASGWVVIDFGDLVAHLFGSEEREYYALADAWPGASEVVRIQ